MHQPFPLILAIFLFSACYAVNFSPDPDAGMVSVSVDETSLQNLLSVYENAGYHDLGTAKKIEEVDQMRQVRRYLLHDFQIDMQDDNIKLNLNGEIDATARVPVGPFHFRPHIRTKGINVDADIFFKDFGLSIDEKNHLNVCLTGVNPDVSHVTYNETPFIDLFIYKFMGNATEELNEHVQAGIDNAISVYADASNCIDLTNHITVGFPEFAGNMSVQHAGTKTKDSEISIYGCPIATSTMGDYVVVSNKPCETVSYNISVYTAKDIDDATTESKISLSLCGDDISGGTKCLPTKQLRNGQISHFVEEAPFALAQNLSLTLSSDNSGNHPGWYVDSVSVDMQLPNNRNFHYWFPIHRWIGGTSPTTFTFNENDNMQIYTFYVETGDEDHFHRAGTSDDIQASVCDINDKCLSFLLDKDNHDDFEVGTTSAFTFVTKENLANVKKMTLSNLWNGQSNPGWYVKYVVYTHASFPESFSHSALKDGQVFMFNQWLAMNVPIDNEKGMDYTEQTILGPNSSKVVVSRYVMDNFGYKIGIKTIDGNQAGTNANIRLTLEGCSGEIQTFKLDDDMDNFERGIEDWFFLTGTKNLKGIKKVKLHNDQSNSHPGWSPEWISVTPVNYDGLNEVVYSKDADGKEDGLYNKPFFHIFNRGLNSEDGWTWESDNQSCPDIQTPAMNPFNYTTHPGNYVMVYGLNLDMAQNITMILTIPIEPALVTRDYALFKIPESTPLAKYEQGPIIVDGIIQNVTIEVLGEKPILDGIAVVSAKPGDAFEVSMRNIDVTSKFYLGNILLDFLGLSNSGAYVRIPRNIEKGMYPFRVSSNGWDITFDEIIEIVESVVPHILSVSSDVAYTGQSIKITGKNFGTEVKDIVVKIGDAVAIVESLSDDEITIQIPTGVSGKGIAVKVIREEVSAPETTTIDIKSLPFFMSFDDTNHPWTSAIATLSYDNHVKFGDEGYSLKVHGNGYMTIESPIFNTYELGAISNELLLDVWIPEDQANPFWYGEVQMSVNIPAAGLYNAWVGQISLTGLAPGWNTLSFPLNWDIYSALAGDYPNAKFSIIMNVNQNSEDYRIDNLRFGGNVMIRTTEHIVASTILDVSSADFMSFDNVNDWTSTWPSILFVEAPKTEGLGAAGITASGYTEIKSRPFMPSELEYISNTIALDVYVPNPQPNDYWVGNVGLGLDCPDGGFGLMFLGNVELTHMFREEFNSVQFLLPNEAVAALRYGIGECSFSIYMNVNNGAGLFLLDNMGFVRMLEVAGSWR